MERKRNMVTYKKQIATEEPEIYAECVLEFDGLTDKWTMELREAFNRFFEDVEKIVKKETSLAR